jgi:hypothetical protein
MDEIHFGIGTALTARSDRGARAFVWSVWLVMILVALACLAKYGRSVPFSEDWLLVPPLTGNEPNLMNWLWAQNNEHRIPFPRLILLGLLKATHGDFRAGMLFNIIVLGALSLAMIRVARHVRGGRTSFADAFFPIALLHLGNWENLFWSWQITQIIPMVLTCVILLTLTRSRTLATPGAAVLAGISLVLLPLSGANGLIFVPLIALWLGYCGVLQWRAKRAKEERWWIGGFLLGSAAIAIFLTGLYFVGYERPPHSSLSSGLGATLQAALQFLALGFGPIARSSWTLSMIAAIGVLLPSAVVVVLEVLRHRGQERHRALGVLAFLASTAVFALAMGWGRSKVLLLSVWGGIWPTRYVLLAVPALFAAFLIWELYGPTNIRSIVQYGLFLGMFLLIPFNTIHGFWWYDWYLEGVEPFERDLRAGVPLSSLAERNREFLFRWMDPGFDKLRMLQEAGIGLFSQMQEDPADSKDSILGVASTPAQPQAQSIVSSTDIPLVTQEIRYYMPEAGEVYLVWGLNGWHVAPEELRPAGTEVKDNVMHTPMIQKDDAFVAKVAVPAETAIDYCFRITKKRGSFDITWPLCEGNYREILTGDGVTEVETNLTLALVSQEIRYRMPEAGEVHLIWGLNGWHVAPEELRPAGTEVKNNVMHTPMVRQGDTFVAQVGVPAGTTIDYGLQITERRGLFDIVYPIWDGNYQEIPPGNSVTEVEAAVTLARDLWDVLDKRLYFLAGVGALLCTWLAAFFFLGFVHEYRSPHIY